MLVAYGAAFGEGPSVMAEVLPYAAFSTQGAKVVPDSPPIPACEIPGHQNEISFSLSLGQPRVETR